MKSQSTVMYINASPHEQVYETCRTAPSQTNQIERQNGEKKLLSDVLTLGKRLKKLKIGLFLLAVVVVSGTAAIWTWVLLPAHRQITDTNGIKTDIKTLKSVIGNVKERQSLIELDVQALKIEPALVNNVPRTCEQATNFSGLYYIWPLEREDYSFQVRCRAEASNGRRTVKTLIGHDSEYEISVGSCEAPYCYKRNVTYSVPMGLIVGLIDASKQCRQFIKYRCLGSMLSSKGRPFAAWVSRNGTLKHYWGGSYRDRYCACGEKASCIDNRHKCNCDQNSGGITTSDEGYLTNKDDLPVTAMYFGDTGGSNEFGWHTLGKLECW